MGSNDYKQKDRIINAYFENYDDNDSITPISKITLIKLSTAKLLFLVPILSLLFSIVFAILLYYYP